MNVDNKGDNHGLLAGRVDNVYLNVIPKYKIFYPDEIKGIIESMEKYFDELNIEDQDSPESFNTDTDFILKQKKNELNSLSEEYFDTIVETHLMYFHNLDEFLGNPRNLRVRESYRKIARLIKKRSIVIQRNVSTFDEVLEEICSEMFNHNENSLKGHEDNCILLIDYMYWNCDIGKKVKDNAITT